MNINKRSLLLWLATTFLFVAYVAAYEHYTNQAVQQETERYAALLEIHLWNYDFDSTSAYLAIIGQARDYAHLSVNHNDGARFAEQNAMHTFWALDNWLHTLGLQPEVTFRIPLRHDTQVIGELIAVWRNRNIYLHLNVALLLILVVAVANYAGKVAGQEHELHERRRMEAALRQSEAKWRSLVENAPDIILTLDRDLRLTYINRGEGPLTPSLLQGKKITEMFPSPNATKGVAAFSRVLATGEQLVYDADFVDPRTGVQRFYSARMGPVIEDGVINSVLLIVTEVTDKKRRDMELQRAKSDAEKANRLKTDFLANMSHEIRTPLNVILGYTSLVEKFARSHLPSERVVYFEYIRNAGHRLMDTIQKIVDISRFHIEDFPFASEPVAIGDIVEACVGELRVLAEQKGLTLHYSPPLRALWVNFDRYALTQIITNIVENAIKYTEEGRVDVLLSGDGTHVYLQVQDTGIGISADYLPNIFDEFSQEESGYSRPFEGTGLGMALVKKFLDLGGGEIKISSEKGKGTSVDLKFAATAAPSQASLRQAAMQFTPAATTPAAAVRRSVLVIEDDASTQAFMRTALGDSYDVRVASSGSEAEAAIAESCPDLILMDLSLRGGEDGIGVTRKIRARVECRDTPIIALTAHALDADRDNALAAGCNDYLAKPCPLDKLLETVARYTAQKT